VVHVGDDGDVADVHGGGASGARANVFGIAI